MGFAVRSFAALCLVCLTLPVQAEINLSNTSGPLRVRNVSPVMQLYGIPRFVDANTLQGDLEASYNFEAANNFQSDLVGNTFVFFDGETYVNSWRVRDDFADTWEWGVEIPWVVHAPGNC